MARVTGIGGMFFKSKDPERLYRWYQEHLGIQRLPDGSSAMFEWGGPGSEKGMTVWAIFPQDSAYLGPPGRDFMMNFRVDDLDALLEQLQKAGVEIDPKREDYDYGRFAWIVDPDGNRVELWQPPRD